MYKARSLEGHVGEVGEDLFSDLLYRRHAPVIFAFLLRHTATREDAEDLLLEVFITALEWEQFAELAESEQLTWLRRVARNKTIDSFRRNARRAQVALDQVAPELAEDETYSPEQNTLRQEEYQRLYALLKTLTPLQRDVLRLRFAHDLRCVEIAAVLEKKPAAVRVLLMRTLRFLRTIYTGSDHTQSDHTQ